MYSLFYKFKLFLLILLVLKCRFIYVPCPHTAEVLSEVLVGCLVDWNLDRKLSTLTVDNCTTNDAMINIVLNRLNSRHLMLSGEFFI